MHQHQSCTGVLPKSTRLHQSKTPRNQETQRTWYITQNMGKAEPTKTWHNTRGRRNQRILRVFLRLQKSQKNPRNLHQKRSSLQITHRRTPRTRCSPSSKQTNRTPSHQGSCQNPQTGTHLRNVVLIREDNLGGLRASPK